MEKLEKKNSQEKEGYEGVYSKNRRSQRGRPSQGKTERVEVGESGGAYRLITRASVRGLRGATMRGVKKTRCIQRNLKKEFHRDETWSLTIRKRERFSGAQRKEVRKKTILLALKGWQEGEIQGKRGGKKKKDALWKSPVGEK